MLISSEVGHTAESFAVRGAFLKKYPTWYLQSRLPARLTKVCVSSRAPELGSYKDRVLVPAPNDYTVAVLAVAMM